MGEFAATFAASDTNGDGMLVSAEFGDFMQKLEQNQNAAGIPHQSGAEYSDEEKDQIFAIFNAKTPDTAGVSMADFFACMKDISTKIQELGSQ